MSLADQGWNYKISVTIEATQVLEDTTDFIAVITQDYNPILKEPDNFLNLNSPRPLAFSNGQDLRVSFDKEGNDLLSFDLVSIETVDTEDNLGDSELLLHVRVPSVSSSSRLSNRLWIWWGNDQAGEIGPDDPLGQYAVYRNDITGILYSPEGGILNGSDDRTENVLLGTQDAATLEIPPSPLVEGLNIPATKTTSGGKILIQEDSQPDLPNQLTFSLFHYFQAGSDRDGYILTVDSGGNPRSYLFIPEDTNTLQLWVATVQRISIPNALIADQWNYIGLRRDIDGIYHLTVNDIVDSAPGPSYTLEGTRPFLTATLGRDTGNGRAPIGWTQYMSIFDGDKGQGWIEATRDSVFNKDDVYQWGYVFYPEGFSTGRPVVNTSEIRKGHQFEVDDVVTGHPQLGTSEIQSQPTFIPEDTITGRPEVGIPLLEQTHFFDSANITTGPAEIESPALFQEHDLGRPDDVATGAVKIESPVFRERHLFEAQGIETGRPIQPIGVASVRDDGTVLLYVRQRDRIRAGSPVLGQSELQQTLYTLKADNITTGRPVLDDVEIQYTAKLEADDVETGHPELSTSQLEHTHNLIPEQIETEKPVLGESELEVVVFNLLARSFRTPRPRLRKPFIDRLDADNLNAIDLRGRRPVINSSNVEQVHFFGGQGRVLSAPLISETRIEGQHVLESGNVKGNAPVIETSALSHLHILKPENIEDLRPILGSSEILSTHNLTPDSYFIGLREYRGIRTAPPVIPTGFDRPIPRQNHIMGIEDRIIIFDVQNPDSPVFFGADYLIIPENIATGTPQVKTAGFTQTHNFRGFDKPSNTIGIGLVPQLDSAGIGQTHSLEGDNISTGTPVIPDIVKVQIHIKAADQLATGRPILGESEISPRYIFRQDQQTFRFDAVTENLEFTQRQFLTTRGDGFQFLKAPVLDDKPLIEQTHSLPQAQDITSGEPELGTSNLIEVYPFGAENISSGQPKLGTSNIEKRFTLEADGLQSEVPVLSTSDIAQAHHIEADDLETPPAIVNKVIVAKVGQTHTFVGENIGTNQPVLQDAMIRKLFLLHAADLRSGIPDLDDPELTSKHFIESDDLITGSPVLGDSFLFEILTEELFADDLVARAPIVRPAGLDGYTGPPLIRREPREISDDVQPERQGRSAASSTTALNSYTPEKRAAAWAQQGRQEATSNRYSYSSGDVLRVAEGDLEGALIMVAETRFSRIDWSNYELKKHHSSPTHKETGKVLRWVRVLDKKMPEEFDEDEPTYVTQNPSSRPERIPLITE